MDCVICNNLWKEDTFDVGDIEINDVDRLHDLMSARTNYYSPENGVRQCF